MVKVMYGIIYHSGIKGMKWGVRNGPPYPINQEDERRDLKFEEQKNKSSASVRRAKKSDVDSIMDIFNSISSTERKFLAYDNKASLIRRTIKSERHCYVATHENKVVGFLRESGRPEGFSLLEEIVVHPEFRGQGIATKLLNNYHREFNKTMAKTNAANFKMISMLRKHGYTAQNPDAPRIINWVRNVETS